MPFSRPNDRYIEELVYLHNAERTLLQFLPALQSVTASAPLRGVFHEEMQCASDRHERIERLLKRYGIRTSPMRQRSIDALVNEVHKLIEHDEQYSTLDASVAAFVQRFVDQEMAGYRVALACAEEIGDDYGANLLAKCLTEYEPVDAELTRFAYPPGRPSERRPRI